MADWFARSTRGAAVFFKQFFNEHLRHKPAVTFVACLLIFVAGISLPAQAQTQASFTATKTICAAYPAWVNPNTCTHPTIVQANTPVIYVFQVTGLPGSATQNITISETAGPGNSGWPVGFTPSAIQCGSTTFPANATSMSFTLMQSQTVTCTAYGVFAPTTPVGSVTNTATVSSNQSSSPMHIQNNVSFQQTSLLAEDLSIAKSVSPTSINITNAPQNVTYTITVKNNSSTSWPIAPWFTLHDNLALLPSSVPLNVTYVSTTCSLSPNPSPLTQCLVPPPTTVNSPLFVGTSAPHSLIDWSYPGSTGQIGPNDFITLTITVAISRIPGLNCVQAPGNVDGLANTAYFTLATSGSAKYDIDSTNDTTPPVNLSVNTGQTTVNPDCGKAQLKLTKVQTAPLASPVPWAPGPPASAGLVSYDINITNTSLPAQTINILGNNFQDLVTEGVNTPPFTRAFVAVACTSSSAGVCPSALGPPTPPHTYSYYTEQNLAYQGVPIVPAGRIHLLPGQTAHVHLTFRYSYPDCDSVPLANPKPIINTAKITYYATPIGAPPGAAQIQYVQTADATTYMQTPPKACKFVVKKKLISGGPHVNFSPGAPPLVYQVSFTNNDAPRHIGTIMDMVRLTDPAYASPLAFNATWQCSTQASNPVQGFASFGNTPAGQAIFTNAPTQGSIVMVQPVLGSQQQLFFPTGSTLTCTIQIWVHRPPFNSPNCSSIPTDFENAAVMDTTRPYNPNGFWPISGIYNPASASNPNPQDKNWATVRTPLPKCFDVTINKSATVAGVSPPWTSAGGPPIDYTIAVTNPSNSPLSGSLTGSTWNGLIVTDTISTPYQGNTVLPGPPSASVCVSPAWCHQFPNPPPTQAVGVASLVPGGSGNWNISLQPPFIVGQSVNNCAKVKIGGDFANLSDWYPNYNPLQSTPNGQNSCVSVPVVATSVIKIGKEIVNHTGSSITLPPLSFTGQVSCSPLPLQNAQTSHVFNTAGGTIANNGSVFSGGWGLTNVPLNDQCTITETPPQNLVLAHSPCLPGGTLQWTTTYSPAQTITVQTIGSSLVMVNELTCHNPVTGGVKVIKQFVNGTGVPVSFPQQTFPVNVNCSGGQSTVLPLQTPAITSSMTTSTSAPGLVQNLLVGTHCWVTENTTALPIPQQAVAACTKLHETPYWVTTISPVQPVAVIANTNVGVLVVNKIGCHYVPPPATLDLIKYFVDATGSPTPIGPLTFNVQVNCTGMPATVVPLQTPATNTTSTSQTGTVSNISVSSPTSCTASEPGLTAPPGVCVDPATGAQGIASWTTTYAPAQTVNIVSGNNILQITNLLSCYYPQPQTSSLDVTKIFDDATGSPTPIGPLTFGVQALCGGVTTQLSPQTPATATSSTSTVTSVSNLPVGTQCGLSEPNLTIPPNVCNNTNPPGIPTWTTTYSPTSSVTTVAGSNPVQITNTLGCNPPPPVGSLDITKVFVDATGSPVPIGPLTFAVQSLCGSATASTLLQTPATATTSTSLMGQVGNLAVGTTCVVSEPVLPTVANACVNAGPPGTPTWATTYAPSSTINIVNGSNQVQVTNTLSCQYPPPTGTLSVTKTYDNQTGINVSVGPLTFGVQVLCGTATTTLPLTTPATATTSTSPPGQVQNLPLNTQCTASEPNLTVPFGICNIPGIPPMLPYWVTTYAPSGPVNIGAGSNALQVTNTLKCSPTTAGDGSLTLIKTADWDANMLSSFPVTFPILLSCTLPNNSVMSQVVNIGVNGNGSFQQTFWSLAVGTVCTATESAPTYSSTSSANFWQNMLSGYCNWHTSYPFTQTVTIQPGTNVLQVVNEQMCGSPSTPSSITVQEEKTPIINGVVNYQPGVSFAINVSCTDPNNQPQSHNWVAATGSSAFDHSFSMPAGSTCSWSETPPPLPPNANPQCYWQTLYFYDGNAVSPGQSIPITTPPANAPFNWMNIQNQLVCPNGQVVVIQPVSRVIRPGGDGHGGGQPNAAPQCDRASSNGQQQACACPKGTTWKNGKCVKKKSALDDILGHVKIDVGVGVGGGGSGKPKSGDTKPAQNGDDGR